MGANIFPILGENIGHIEPTMETSVGTTIMVNQTLYKSILISKNVHIKLQGANISKTLKDNINLIWGQTNGIKLESSFGTTYL